MILETVRLVVAALAHDAYGVNAQLDAVPRFAGDAAPDPVAEIIDATTNDRRMADGEKRDNADGAPRWPALVVLEDDAAEAVPEVGTVERDGEVGVTIAYLARDPDAAGTAAASGYTRRAVVRAIKDWLDPARDAERAANGVYVIAATELRFRPAFDAVGALPHAGAVTVTFQVRDLAP